MSVDVSAKHNMYQSEDLDPGFGAEIRLTHKDSGLYMLLGADEFYFKKGDQSMLDMWAIGPGIGTSFELLNKRGTTLSFFSSIAYRFAINNQKGSAPEAIRYHFRQTLPGEEQPVWPNPEYMCELEDFFQVDVGLDFNVMWSKNVSSGFRISYAYAKAMFYAKYWSDELMQSYRDNGWDPIWWETYGNEDLSHVSIDAKILEIRF